MRPYLSARWLWGTLRARASKGHGRGVLPPRLSRTFVVGLLSALLGLAPGCTDTGVSVFIQSIEITRMPSATRIPEVSPEKICSGDVVKVEVTPKIGLVTRVEINGYPGEIRYLQFNGRTETVELSVTASVLGQGKDAVVREIEILDCITPDMPDLRAQPSIYDPFAVDFIVVNQAALSNWQNGFHWDFGDGEPVEMTGVPYVRHSYEAATDGREMYESFEVTLANKAAGEPDRLVRKHQISVLDYTRIALQKGIIQPRAWATGPLEIVSSKLVGRFRIRNTRSEPIVLTHAIEEQQPCADLAAPIRSEILVSEILFQGGYDDYEDPQGLSNAEIQALMADEDYVYYQEASNYGSALENQPAEGFVTRPSPAVHNLLPTLGSPIALPAIDPSILGSLVIPHESVHEASFKLEAADYGLDICVLSYHFRGISGGGFPVVASLHYELRPDPAETQFVVDGALITFLEAIIDNGWVSDPGRITTEELFQLQQSGKIRQTPSGWEIVE